MTYDPVWGLPIALYLFLAGLGGGAFITSTVLRWKSPSTSCKMRVFGHYLSFVVVAIGLVLLMIDAKAGFTHPLRFVLLLTNFGSVMTWGVVFLAAFMVIDLVVCLLDFLKRNVPFWLEVVGSVLGVAVGMYTGALLGVAHTFPLWNTAILPVLFLVSAVSTGAAAVLLYGALFAPDELDAAHWVKKAHYYFPVIEIVLVAALLFITASNGEAGFNSAMTLLVGKYSAAFWIGFVVVGLVVPVLVETWLTFGGGRAYEEERLGHRYAAVSHAFVLVGGFLLRYLVIVAALPVTLVTPWM